VASWRR